MGNEQKNDLSILKEYKNKFKKWAIFAAVFILALVAVYFKASSSISKKYEPVIKELQDKLDDTVALYEEATKEISLALIQSEIKDIGELATVEYLYTDAGKFEDPAKLFGKEIPFSFTTKSFVAKWDGIIKAGVKVEEIDVEISEENKEIIIHMPEAEILSHEIDENSIETLDEKNGLFNSISVEDIRQFDAISKEEMEKRAIENGILDKAFENAKSIIEKLVNNETVQEQGYTIIFKNGMEV